MGLMSSLTVKPLLIACGVLLAACIALVGTIVVKDARHDAAITKVEKDRDTCGVERAAAEVKVSELARANASQQLAVEDLADKLNRAIDETERLDELLTISETNLRDAHLQRDIALADLNDLREITYANDPSAAAWGALPVPAAISDGVHQRWRAARSPARPN
ncbi:MAG TPA: hypothetical protein VGK41_01240 [Solirubrobacterales bacterium]